MLTCFDSAQFEKEPFRELDNVTAYQNVHLELLSFSILLYLFFFLQIALFSKCPWRLGVRGGSFAVGEKVGKEGEMSCNVSHLHYVRAALNWFPSKVDMNFVQTHPLRSVPHNVGVLFIRRL